MRNGWAFSMVLSPAVEHRVCPMARCPPRFRERLFFEGVRHPAHAADDPHLGAVGAGNAGALLSLMLQGIQPQRGQARGLGMPEDSKNAALVFEFIHF